MKVRRSGERGFEDSGWTDNWFTFSFGGYHHPDWMHFGPLRVMVENHIQPHSGFPVHPHHDVEIVTYVSSGILTHGDNFGHKAEIRAGEMQVISAGSAGMHHSEENLHDDVEHNLQLWFVPERYPTAFAYHQKGFEEAERTGRLRLYVSPDGRDGSMPVQTDVFVYAGLFNAGDSATHRLRNCRGLWIQLVKGAARASFEDETELKLEQGDGAGISDTGLVKLSFDGDAEILVIDVNLDAHRIWT